MKDERALQTKCLGWLRALDGIFENRSPGPFGSVGVPDITGVFRGRPLAIELKNPNTHHAPGPNDTRWPSQRKFLRDVHKYGGLALGTNDFEMVCTLIRYIDSELDDYGISRVQPVYWERFI